jgi:YVTN family beta-propeller protein
MLPPPYRFKSARLVFTLLFTLSLLTFWLTRGASVPGASAQLTLPTAPFRNFESPQVHPLALTPDGTRLLAVNSPNATLSVFQLAGGGVPLLTAEIPVGLEPVSVVARSNREAWVVNWLSDSVSIVDLSTGNVTQTIEVGDEPTDVLFAGPGDGRAFVCVSGRSQVRVFDAANPSATTPQVLDIFGKQPRALARDAAGNRVFVSVFESGSQTTLVPEPLVRTNGGVPAPAPARRVGLPVEPSSSLIVKWNGASWADETGDTRWDALVNYTLADVDLVVLDASTEPATVSSQVRGLGTHLGNMAFDSAGGRLFVTNADSTNVMRFEPNLRGRFQSSRVSVVDVTPGGAASLSSTHDLNPHVNFGVPNGSDAERSQSLALPADLARSSDGTLYVAATSSARVGVLASDGELQSRVPVGQGPTGLAVDDARQRLYVLNRFDQTLSVVDTNTKQQLSLVPVGFNPEPALVRNGRRFLYDASFSAHGLVSCASCHPSGHRDGLAWDLGDPLGTLVNVGGFQHHPMKGPMTTQSLRGIVGTEPLHWRGDRNNLAEFNAAFTGLLGSPRLLTPGEMTAFNDFVRTLTYPPNPNENLDRTFPDPPSGPSARRGSDLFRNALLSGFPCNLCHRALLAGGGFDIGTDRVIFSGSILGEPQQFKVPQLRGLYQKTGLEKPPAGSPRTEQLTGFGFTHDGSFDSLLNFLRLPFFNSLTNDNQRRDIEAFLLAFDTGTAPCVGSQVTVNAENKNSPEVTNRLGTLILQANARNCDLIARGIYGGRPRGFFNAGGLFQHDSLSEGTVLLTDMLNQLGAGEEMTFTGVPVGAGIRMAADRNTNNVLDDDEELTSVSLSGRVVDAAGNGVEGVTVTLSGTQSATTRTLAGGKYAFHFVSTSGTHTITPQGTGIDFNPSSRTFVNPTWNPSAIFVTKEGVNVSDSSAYFVRQHYNDFLNREPDTGGLAFWTNEIESCGADANCRALKRQNVSAAFFLSIEFRDTGYLVYRLAKASFGDLPGKPVPITFQRLMLDSQRIGRNFIVGVGEWQGKLESNRLAFLRGWVQRPEFLARYPLTMTPTAFVDALNANTGGSLTQVERDGIVNELASALNLTQGRMDAVLKVAENAEFSRRESNKAFVLMQFFGYLRRNPDEGPNPDFRGYDFWLQKLNDNGGNFINAQMVEAFITSLEYRERFGTQ